MEKIKSNTRSMEFIDPNTVLIQYFDDIDVSLIDSQIDYELFIDFTKNKRVKKIIVSGIYTRIDSQARKYIHATNIKRSELIIAEAIVVNSLPDRLLGNAYLKIVRYSFPIKMFNSLDQAKEWINKY